MKIKFKIILQSKFYCFQFRKIRKLNNAKRIKFDLSVFKGIRRIGSKVRGRS